jgi:hypothetical protein
VHCGGFAEDFSEFLLQIVEFIEVQETMRSFREGEAFEKHR